MPGLPPGPLHLEGTVRASQTRAMKPTDDAGLAALLKHYEEPAVDIAWTMDRLRGVGNYDIYDLRFPSPVVTDVPENNTVYCEYYRCRGDQKRPAVIVLHISDGKFVESRAICHYLATQGFDGLMLKMAYYGPRRPKDRERMRALTQNLDTLCEGVRQSAMDARRAARWLGAQPLVDPAQISILGTSLGGFVASVASGVDGRFARSVFVLAGGDLARVLSTRSREVRSIREAIEVSGMSPAQLTKRLELIDPCTFAGRIDPATVMMVNTRSDPVVPPPSAEALSKAIGGAKIEWYDGDHYALIWRLFEVLARVTEHLNERPAPSSR
jgi:dienelactone hydrolase